MPAKEKSVNERAGLVTMRHNPVTLVGNEVHVDRMVPDFEAVDNDLNTFRFYDLKDKIVIIASVPSLDTAVCDMETRRFNQEAASMDESIRILTISMDICPLRKSAGALQPV